MQVHCIVRGSRYLAVDSILGEVNDVQHLDVYAIAALPSSTGGW